MWISKPIKALSSDEAFFYQKMSEEKDFPLSQTLLWGKAIEASGGECYATFETVTKVGGLAFFYQDTFECINGPILSWGEDIINEEVATFVYALTKAKSPVKKVSLKPRWDKVREAILSNHLKFPIHSFEETSTKVMNVPDNAHLEQFLGAKIKHELGRVDKYRSPLRTFTPKMEDFYKGLKADYDLAGIFLPEIAWFKAMEDQSKLFGAEIKDQIKTQIMVTRYGHRLFYLFAFESREISAPNISLNLFLQRNIIEWCEKEKIKIYDLGGYKKNIDREDNYWGVKVFKDKFPGELKDYVSPLFIFE